jgi:hypothetical protein
MQHPQPSPCREDIQEGHLRLAVLLDQIGDRLEAGLPLGGRIALLAAEFDHHARHKEAALANAASAGHSWHCPGYDTMRRLLERLAAAHFAGGDIRPLLDEVQRLFVEHLLPAERAVWCASS